MNKAETIQKALPLLGKTIKFSAHHEAYPSYYINGTIIGFDIGDYSKTINLIVKTESKEEKIEVCDVILKGLVEEGKYDNNWQFSRSDKTYFIQ